MRRSAQMILGLISILIAAGAGLYGRNAYLYQVSTLTLPVPRQVLPAYTPLTAELFEMREFPRAMEAMPYHRTLQDLAGTISTADLAAGLPIAREYAVPVDRFRLADPSREVVSIPVSPVSAVGGQIRIGERINLYQMKVVDVPRCEASLQCQVTGDSPLTLENERLGEVALVAGDLLVVDVRSSRGEEAGPEQTETDQASKGNSASKKEERGQTQILTLAVPPELVEGILKAVVESENAGGTLWVSLALP